MNCSFLLIMALLFQIVYTEEFNDDSEQGIERENRACAGDCSIPRVDTSPSKQKSTHIAQDAALEASAAREAQNTAGAQASHQIKLQLAERAEEAAKTAEAAYLAKQAIVEELEQELREAREVAHEEQENLRDERHTLEAAMKAAQEAQNELKLLQESVQLSELNVINAVKAAKGAQAAVEDKEKLLEAAKIKIEEIIRELKIAEEELAATRAAAERAISAAKEAKINAEKTRKRSAKQEIMALCFQLIVPQPTNEVGKNPIAERNVISNTSKVHLLGSGKTVQVKSATTKPVTKLNLNSPKIHSIKSSTSKPNMDKKKNQPIKLPISKPLNKKNLIGTNIQQLKKSNNAVKPLKKTNLNTTKVQEVKSTQSVNSATLTSTPACPDKLSVANKINESIKQAKEEAYKQLMILEEDKRVIQQELDQVILNASKKVPKPNMDITK
ncbi:hypothetical protein FQR65_LT02914 [Abscondita terminalis]|nr:hypothetical protein FQR65_LT02914 [Abscondita terminalis]